MNIFSILKTGYSEREGIYIPESTAGETVWDTLATDDLLDAATSATSEDHAIKKGESQISELVRDAQDGILLDVGCGYGRVAENVLPQRTFDAYIGIDGSIEMLRFAHVRKKGRTDIATPMYFVYGEIDSLPLADATVDTVVVSAVFLHNHKSITERSLKEIERVLRPGGKLFVYGSFPNVMSLMGVQGALYNALFNTFGNPYRNGPVRYFTKGEVSRYFRKYTDVKIVPVGFVLLPKNILIFPKVINARYAKYVANPVNNFFAKILPDVLKKRCAMHHDVIASK